MYWKKASTLLLLYAATAIISPAQTVTTLASFDQTNGATPRFGSLVQATNGDLYGTTQAGGANNYGTIFKITPAGLLTTLHSFNLTDGANPTAGLVQATNGDLYGTTSLGGNGMGCSASGCGTIFKITVDGALITLYNLNLTDGIGPGGLIQAANRDFYGTTTERGAGTSTNCPGGCGTIFKITPAGALTVLHNFDSTDGGEPGDLVQATNGELYGTTMIGGSGTACVYGCGTIFKITPAGALTTIHSFNGHDGSLTNAGLVQATNGDLYGTTFVGGNLCAYNQTCGTIFKITPAGVFTTLHNFSGTDGASPEDRLVQGTDGDLYGTTFYGGSNYYSGTIFRITPAGVLTTLHVFEPPTAGGDPAAGLVQDTNGDLYGTTMDGGPGKCSNPNGCGTVFKLSVGLAPFVRTLPNMGGAGSAVRILGTDLSGATSVTFNGIAAAFSVVSPTQILARVPSGATTGKVQVTTPGGTLLSNVGFVVP